MSRDRRRFEHLVAVHAGAVTAYARAMTNDRWTADDAVQETFLRAWKYLDSFRGSGSFEEPVVRRYLWSRSYSAEEYLALLSTYSGHVAASPQQREHLFADIRRRTESRAAAGVRKHYLNLLQVARRFG